MSRPLAGLRRRLASLLYEVLLLAGLWFVAASLFLALLAPAGMRPPRLLLQAWLLCAGGAYFLSCWCRSGQTLPMKTWDLWLGMADGTPVGLDRALLRYVAAAVGSLFGLGFLWALVDPQRQFLHDRLVGTRIFQGLRAGPPDGR